MMQLAGEITRDEAMKTLLTDEDLSDITLKGSDGTLVLAQRCMLAARSFVFRRMLYGDFCEASQSLVDVGYTGDVLQAIVDYIYTNTTTFFNQETFDEAFVVALIDAATYFELSELLRQALDAARSAMEKNSSLCITFLSVCETNCALADELEVFALEKIRSDPKMLLNNESMLASLSSTRIEEIVKDDNLLANEYTVFLILQAWSNAEDDEDITTLDISPRKHTAKRLTQYLSLELIRPVDISTTVASSGFVTNDQICNAYKAQSLCAEHQNNISYQNFRMPVWRNSQTVVVACENIDPVLEILSCPVLRTGIHTWSILVQQASFSLELGLASTVHTLDHGKSLGEQPGAWGYTSSGNSCHNSERMSTYRPFGEGSTVTFVLDLTGQGTLCASVDDNPAVSLFTDMRSVFLSNNEIGFVPAACLDVGSVRFLGFG
jgi:hypothetical protein